MVLMELSMSCLGGKAAMRTESFGTLLQDLNLVRREPGELLMDN